MWVVIVTPPDYFHDFGAHVHASEVHQHPLVAGALFTHQSLESLLQSPTVAELSRPKKGQVGEFRRAGRGGEVLM